MTTAIMAVAVVSVVTRRLQRNASSTKTPQTASKYGGLGIAASAATSSDHSCQRFRSAQLFGIETQQ